MWVRQHVSGIIFICLTSTVYLIRVGCLKLVMLARTPIYLCWVMSIIRMVTQFLIGFLRGGVAAAFLHGSVILSAAMSASYVERYPLVTALQGHFGGLVANTTSSFMNHMLVPHGSVELRSRKLFETMRFAQAALVGILVDRSTAVHRVHHPNSDTAEDPHAPANLGRWYVYFHITKIVRDFERDNPGLVQAEQADYRTSRRFYDRKLVTIAGILGTHLLVGKALGQPVKNRIISAAIHTADAYLLNATFTADAHMYGEPRNIKQDPLTEIIFPESNHGDHHQDPGNPRHAKYSPPYFLAKALERVCLATIPKLPSKK